MLTNNGSGLFVLAASPPVGVNPMSLVAADVNGDGRVDLISANSGDGTLSVLLNAAFNFLGSFTGNFSGTAAGLTGVSRLDAPDGYPAPALAVDNDGNVGIGTTTPISKLQVNGVVTATVFNPASDRNLKENFHEVRPDEVLAKVAALPITRWNFKSDEATPHIGPMAQDFHAAFGVGTDDKHIATVDADGVALAAIQGLNQKVELGSQRLEDRNMKLEERMQQKETEIAELKGRLERLEHLVGHNVKGSGK